MGNGELLGSGTRETLLCAARRCGIASSTASVAMSMVLRSKVSSILDAYAELIDDAIGRERRAFLPADQVAGVIAGEVDAAIGDEQRFGRDIAGAAKAADPGAEIVGNFSPADVHRPGEVFAVAGVQQFDGLAGGVKFRFHGGQGAERRPVFDGVSGDDHAALREEARAWIP